MGTVYEAEQESPRRTVALKVIRAGYLSPQLLKRFEHESQVLGRLQHPGIAQVYEAGTVVEEPGSENRATPSRATPFFAMEFIKGVPLTDYAASKNLGTRERLELVARICDAVYHAHQKGVIHRDLKPGNILVDESGQPKILDFGVARATDSDIQQTTIQTDIGQLIGTVPYMSPEQVGGDPDELDTRSDVYALGVIAYELLAGRLPYDLTKRIIHEAVRIIREEEPTRLSSINRTLRGDVETIVAKALEKDKARRYQSAESLASDIRRYLTDQPITARPAGTWYQLKKFSQRNKALVGGVAVSFVILLGGLAGTAWQADEATKQARRADERAAAATKAEGEAQIQKTAAEASAKAEKERAEQLQQVSDFQAQMLAQVDPTEAGRLLTADVTAKFGEALVKANVPEGERAGQVEAFAGQWSKVNATDAARELIDRTILKPAVDAIEKQFKDQPVVDAQLRQVLADRYQNLGLPDSATPLQERALATRRRVLGEEHPDTLTSISNMGTLLRAQGKLSEAEPYYREGLENLRRVLGEEHPDALTSISNMGVLLNTQGKLSEAATYFREALEKRRRVLGEEHPDTLTSISNLGVLLNAQGKLSEAAPYFRETLEKSRRVLGEEHPSTLNSINNMGALLMAQGELSEAEPYFREAMEKRRRALGEEHPDTLGSIHNLGALLTAQGELGEAEPYLRETLEKRRRVLGEEHPDTLGSVNNMGALLRSQGKLGEAEPYYREGLEKSRRVLGEEHPSTLNSINNMGGLLQAQGKLSDAEPYLREALENCRRVLGAEHPDTLGSINNMGGLLKALGRLSEAEPYYREGLEKVRRVLGEDHPDTLVLISNMGFLLQAQGKLGEAEAYHREALERFRRVLGEDHPRTLVLIDNMGVLLQDQGKPNEAEPYYREALEKRRRVLGHEHPSTLISINNMGSLFVAQRKHAEAVALLAPIEGAARTAFTGGNARRLASLLMSLGEARTSLAEFGAAETNLLEAHPIFITTRSEQHKDTRECIQALISLYTAWHAAEPGKGYDTKAAAWNATLEATQPPTQDPQPAEKK